jgi:hypothetical protein
MTTDTPRELGEHAASVLAPETDLLADPDIAGLGQALATVFRGALEHPAEANQAWLRYATSLWQIPAVAMSSWLGTTIEPPVPLNPKDRRFGGHIAGIVNPPGPKGWYMVGTDYPDWADEWRRRATRHDGSWWEDWAVWSAENSGPLVDPPPTGNLNYPVLYDGPGDYIRT